MKKIKVGINGFGRIGRAIYRINHLRRDFDIVAINDINPDIKNMAYMLQYDTTYGRFPDPVKHNENKIFIGEHEVNVHHQQRILDVPWEKHDVDVVIDSSGIKSNLEPMLNDATGKIKFIVTNVPGHKDVKTIIFGVNEEECDYSTHNVFSSSICDTIALAPILKLIQKTHEIESGFLTTLHPWLSYQNLLDGPSASWSQPGDVFSHYALGRASTENLIPKSTSAITAADCVFPGLSEKVQSLSFRTPTKIVSSAVLILMLDKDLTKEELQGRFHEFEKTQKYKVFRNSVEPLTSLDYCGEEFSAIIDQRWSKVERGRHMKLVYWYDNEWGYSNRVNDLVVKIIESHESQNNT